jgi:hypothetical protein
VRRRVSKRCRHYNRIRVFVTLVELEPQHAWYFPLLGEMGRHQRHELLSLARVHLDPSKDEIHHHRSPRRLRLKTFANSLLDTLAPRVAVGAFDRLSVMHQPTARLLDRTLRREGSIELPMSIPVPAEEDKPALVLHLLPVERSAHDIFGSANFVLFATPVTEPNAPTADLLSGLFSLSSAEASVARGVANRCMKSRRYAGSLWRLYEAN